MRVSYKLSGSILVVVTGAVAAFGLLSYEVAGKVLAHRSLSFLSSCSEEASWDIETYLGQHRNSLAQLAKDGLFVRLLSADRSGPGFFLSVSSANEKLARRVVMDPHFLEIDILDGDGVVVASSRGTEVGQSKDATAKRTEIGKEDAAFSSYISDRDKAFVVLVPVRMNGALVGVVKGRLSTAGLYGNG